MRDDTKLRPDFSFNVIPSIQLKRLNRTSSTQGDDIYRKMHLNTRAICRPKDRK